MGKNMVRLIGAVLILFGTVGIGYDRMRQIKRQYENSSPKSCWKEAWKVWENREIFTKEEGQLFLESGRLLEQGSGGMFEKEAELLIERINILIQREQTEMRERIKVSMYLCATAGIFLVLILV